ncbi:DER1-domain-containing protein [Fomitiporia mediterranea MF3/22]|uniref:DER1-domain-containing protein n=1 Tax=Fomitiporia mediterranea (strain MF3/22) TaxID=694068 RepID=UPI00044080D3|nr:DER1-domain-containing protein [Fomitiporia mediterranea MF3/22]EJD05508.1 DER1-domain-containing protein [Fomitiporia mediterranea MF3/22]
MSSFMDEIRKIPPVTRFLCAATLGITIPVNLQLLSPYSIIFIKQLVTQRLEVWRPFTSMFFGGSGIAFLFDFIMLYRNSNSLEEMHYAGRSADFAWQTFINSLSLLALNVPLSSVVHFRPLLLSLITLSSRLSPNAMTSIFGLITLSHQYLPYALVTMDLFMGGPSAAAQSLTGVISGYAWWYLVHNTDAGRPGADFAKAPAWLADYMDQRGEGVVPGVGRVLNADGRRAAAAVRGAARSATGAYNWGSGHRLGSG